MACWIIEFHDSTFDGLEKDGTNVTLRFSAAYIHESNGKTALMQVLAGFKRLAFTSPGRPWAARFLELPCDLWDGSIRLGDELYQMIPIPLDHSGAVEINLEQNGKITVVGTDARLELVGEPTFIEKFPGNR
jgi:hypothetical protein